MTRKHAGYYFAPLLMFVSATALGQVAYTPEQTQSDVSWIPWGIARCSHSGRRVFSG